MARLATTRNFVLQFSSPYVRKRSLQGRMKSRFGEYPIASAPETIDTVDPLPPSEYQKSVTMIEKIEGLAFFKCRWDGYEADPPNQASIALAKKVVEHSFKDSLQPTRVTPSPEGGIAVCYEENGRYADIECFNTGEVWALTSDHRSTPDVWQIEQNVTGLPGALDRIRGYLVASSAG